jgi:hypothetical protein
MDKIVVEGGRRLVGEIQISGAKNAALPLLASGLLADGPSTFKNVPQLQDVKTMGKLLGHLRCQVTGTRAMTIAPPATPSGKAADREAPYELVKTMRASVLVLGPLGRALRAGARVHAGRLRHRRAPDRSAPQGPRGPGRQRRARATATSRWTAKRSAEGGRHHARHDPRSPGPRT